MPCLNHLLAVILMRINRAGRRDLTVACELACGVRRLVAVVPFRYALTGGKLV